jgi:hypothetical protein
MSMAIASLVCIALLIVSLAHFMWGFGRRWPVADEAMLARIVTGRTGTTRMPPWYRSLALAILTLGAAVLALALADHDAGAWKLTAVGAVVALIFLARGIAGYVPAWQRLTPEQPFRSYDVRYYSPLCLIIGLGVALLVILRLT